MDPNEALKNARAALKRYDVASDENNPDRRVMAAADLVDAFEALDGWLSKGGFKPLAWDVPTDTTETFRNRDNVNAIGTTEDES